MSLLENSRQPKVTIKSTKFKGRFIDSVCSVQIKQQNNKIVNRLPKMKLHISNSESQAEKIWKTLNIQILIEQLFFLSDSFLFLLSHQLPVSDEIV